MLLDGWLAAAGDLLLGAECPGCRSPAWGLCSRCRRHVESGRGYLTRPDPCPPGFPATATSFPYDEVMRELVSAHKERQVLTLTPFLAERLAVSLECLLDSAAIEHSGGAAPRPLLLVPVPSSPAAVRERGLDATWALARGAARLLRRRRPEAAGGVVAVRLLTQARRVQDQAGLGAAARRSNLAGSFRLRRSRARPVGIVVIVDDVVTTGSSLAEAARALGAAGIPVLGAATVAATVRSRTTIRSPRPRR